MGWAHPITQLCQVKLCKFDLNIFCERIKEGGFLDELEVMFIGVSVQKCQGTFLSCRLLYKQSSRYLAQPLQALGSPARF